jgi:hypothetical protein
VKSALVREAQTMSQRSVELLVGKLVTDEALLGRFAESPRAFLLREIANGLELTAVERQALTCVDIGACERFAARLDPRIRKVDPCKRCE